MDFTSSYSYLIFLCRFCIIREVCSSDGELVPHVLLHTTDRRTYMKGVSSYFGLGKSCLADTRLRGLCGKMDSQTNNCNITMIRLQTVKCKIGMDWDKPSSVL